MKYRIAEREPGSRSWTIFPNVYYDSVEDAEARIEEFRREKPGDNLEMAVIEASDVSEVSRPSVRK